jgi:uncharacterized low-complexity protein
MAQKKTAVTLALGTAFAASMLAASFANAGDNPFEMQSLKSGYQVAEMKDGNGNAVNPKAKDAKCGGDKAKDAKCGGDKGKEGKCGGDKKKDGKCGEGKCGGDKKKDGKCGEGKCGEGKCGGSKK